MIPRHLPSLPEMQRRKKKQLLGDWHLQFPVSGRQLLLITTPHYPLPQPKWAGASSQEGLRPSEIRVSLPGPGPGLQIFCSPEMLVQLSTGLGREGGQSLPSHSSSVLVGGLAQFRGTLEPPALLLEGNGGHISELLCWRPRHLQL